VPDFVGPSVLVKMNLAVFDIDGTLTRTNEVDGRCFEQALADSYGITGIDNDWGSYSHTTDSAITTELFRRQFGRPPDAGEVSTFRRCFLSLLKECLAANPESFGEVPGASDMLSRLSREPGWAITFATGGWPESAALKLQAVHISLSDFPHASAEDGCSREEIIQVAIGRALVRQHQNTFARIVSIGDAVWDLRTAKNLELDFIGITSDGTAMALSQAGATRVFEDFRDYDAFRDSLSETTSTLSVNPS
jgi:phosphoglycolate phosphatase-like HAD superfamily hydrolase